MFSLTTPVKTFNFIALSFALAACGGDGNNNTEAGTVVDVAIADGNFTTLVTALQATGLDAVLDNEDGSFTVLAPTDDAFADLGADTINALLADPDTLSDILLYHVVSDSEIDSTAAVAAAGTQLTVANGDTVAVSYVNPTLYINTAEVTFTDIQADNGVIHAIDTVLIPPSEAPTPTLNIVETAVDAGSFTTLVAAVQAAGLDATLADPDTEFTVFAPTDAAFAALPEGTVDALLGDIPALTDILLKHVISGSAVDSITALTLNGSEVETAGGDLIDVQIMDGQLFIGGAAVTSSDIATTNGIIHVIDMVITE